MTLGWRIFGETVHKCICLALSSSSRPILIKSVDPAKVSLDVVLPGPRGSEKSAAILFEWYVSLSLSSCDPLGSERSLCSQSCRTGFHLETRFSTRDTGRDDRRDERPLRRDDGKAVLARRGFAPELTNRPESEMRSSSESTDEDTDGVLDCGRDWRRDEELPRRLLLEVLPRDALTSVNLLVVTGASTLPDAPAMALALGPLSLPGIVKFPVAV